MAASRSGAGAPRPLLFERLVDAGPDTPLAYGLAPFGARSAIEASVARELASLLGTRIDPAVDAIPPEERTVLDYGLPDFTGLSAASETDRHRIARSVERAIVAFEPRLAHPKVSVVVERSTRDGIAIVVQGTLNVNAIPTPFVFQVDLTGDGRTDDGA